VSVSGQLTDHCPPRPLATGLDPQLIARANFGPSLTEGAYADRLMPAVLLEMNAGLRGGELGGWTDQTSTLRHGCSPCVGRATSPASSGLADRHANNGSLEVPVAE
jgi:hypothetical protein